jgi:hypothetical protein
LLTAHEERLFSELYTHFLYCTLEEYGENDVSPKMKLSEKSRENFPASDSVRI